jgi:PAS domain-containing protein
MIAPVRVARNVAEKQRRDKLNAFIADLANSVPLVASATKRLDKTSILRLAAAFLRLHDSPLNTIGYNLASSDIVEEHDSIGRPKIIPEHVKALEEGLEGFVIVVNCDLKLIYIAKTCEKFLGHQNIDMMGFPLTAFVHPGDVDAVKHVLDEARRDLMRSGKKESDRIQFRCRMKERSQPRTEVVTYQMVQIVGSFQFPDCKDPSSICNSTISSKSHDHHHDHVHKNLSLTNNNNDVKNNNNLSSSTSSVMDISCNSNSLDSISENNEQQSSHGTSPFILLPSPAATSLHRSDSMSSDCSSFSAVSSIYCSRAFAGKRKFEELSSCPSPGSEAGSSSGYASGYTNGKRSPNLTCVLTSSSSNNSSDNTSLRQHHHPVSPAYVTKNLLFKGFVQVIPSSPMAELSLIDANQEEYVTRLSLDGVLLYADHRFVS